MSGYAYQDLRPKDAAEAVEVFTLGGHGVTLVTQLDGKVVGTGEPGPVFRALAEMVFADSSDNDDSMHHAVPYEAYPQRGVPGGSDGSGGSRGSGGTAGPSVVPKVVPKVPLQVYNGPSPKLGLLVAAAVGVFSTFAFYLGTRSRQIG